MMTSSSGASSSLTGTSLATPVKIIHYKSMESAEDFGRMRGRRIGQNRRNRGRNQRRKSNNRRVSENYLWSRIDPDYYDYYGQYDHNGDYYHYDDHSYYYEDYYQEEYQYYDYNYYDYGHRSPSASTSTSPTSATAIKSMPSSASIPSMAKDIDPGRNPYPPSGQKDGGYGNPAPTGSGTHYLPGIAHEGGNPPVGLTSGGDFHFGNGLTMSEWANDVRTHSEWFG